MNPEKLHDIILDLKATTLELAAERPSVAAQLNLAAAHLHDAAANVSLAAGISPNKRNEIEELEARLAELRNEPIPPPAPATEAWDHPEQPPQHTPLATPPKSNAVDPTPPPGITFATEATDASFAGDAVASTEASPEQLAAEQAAHAGREGADARQTDPVDPQAG